MRRGAMAGDGIIGDGMDFAAKGKTCGSYMQGPFDKACRYVRKLEMASSKPPADGFVCAGILISDRHLWYVGMKGNWAPQNGNC